jgi:uncharacterized RDD family membrane protein YckC
MKQQLQSNYISYATNYHRDEPPAPEPAGFWLRVVAYYFDSIIVGCMLMAITGAVLAVAIHSGVSWLDIGRLAGNPKALFSSVIAPVRVFFVGMILLSLVLPVVYGTLFECSAMQGTPGKFLLGLKVTNYSESRLSFEEALKRNILKYKWLLGSAGLSILGIVSFSLPGGILVALLFMIIATLLPLGMLIDQGAAAFTTHKQTLYDKSADCLVDKKPEVSDLRRLVLCCIAVLLFVVITLCSSHESSRNRHTGWHTTSSWQVSGYRR